MEPPVTGDSPDEQQPKKPWRDSTLKKTLHSISSARHVVLSQSERLIADSLSSSTKERAQHGTASLAETLAALSHMVIISSDLSERNIHHWQKPSTSSTSISVTSQFSCSRRSRHAIRQREMAGRSNRRGRCLKAYQPSTKANPIHEIGLD